MAVPRHIAVAMPLLRLLAVNLAAGIGVAILALGGLLAVSPHLRHLIFADHSPAVPLALLGGGFIVTFGSLVMGTAIMRLGRDEPPSGGRKAPDEHGLSAVRVSAR